jgi:CRP-like cAMP-binding protein
MSDTKKVPFKAGAFLYVEGDVEIRGGDPRIRQYRIVLRAGDISGFTSALCLRPRMESAKTRTDPLVVALPRERFLEPMGANPDLALKITACFAEELHVCNEMGFALRGGRVPLEEGESLYGFGAYYAGKGKKGHTAHGLSYYLRRHADGSHAAEARRLLDSMKAAPAVPPAVQGVYRVIGDDRMVF